MLALHDTNSYCNSLTHYSRFVSRAVAIGGLPLGGEYPIRVQSMTTTDTMDTIATVNQSIRMIDAGCEYVRITAPSLKEAQNLENIKKELKYRGYHVPLIADIHYTPNAAELAARIVEKVRINPGNYADKKKFENIEYTDKEYEAELQRIRERFTPLVKICKQYGTAMRIGTNHGSLSDRIMSRYGDTPHGMVESAFEFLRICEEENYYNIVLSMKASNPQVMVQAYRLLVNKMLESGRNYPLHLGVTEAGDGEDGRIKSAIGIGTLLEDGLGDTVRVSLTEDPEFEIPVAKALINRYHNRVNFSQPTTHNPQLNDFNLQPPTAKRQQNYSPFKYSKRESITIHNIGGKNVPRVVIDFSNIDLMKQEELSSVDYKYSASLDKWNLSDMACDYIYTGKQKISFEIPGTLGVIVDAEHWDSENPFCFPLFSSNEYACSTSKSSKINFIKVYSEDIAEDFIDLVNKDRTAVLIIETNNSSAMAELRSIFFQLLEMKCDHPVIIKRNYVSINESDFQLYSATDTGSLLIDGFGDGLWLSSELSALQVINKTSFNILQATRTRISKTEYISCPSCGRTLFDLQETTAKIRSKTAHLKGIKIGIMGCIVNGPGEMADADYGYVGVGIGKITLYKGKQIVRRSIPSERAVDSLIELIKEHGDWVDPDLNNGLFFNSFSE
jgi:(E)-4-hydroxy-3-methylbut-2-enyl-diphosphate synthase